MMKKLLCVMALMAFAVAAQAGDPAGCGMGCGQPKSGRAACCCAKGKGEQAKPARAHRAKAGSKDTAAKQPLHSPKALSLACR